MKLINFEKHFKLDKIMDFPEVGCIIDGSLMDSRLAQLSEFTDLFVTYSTGSFNKGVYRIHDVNDLNHWTDIITNCFPEFLGRICAMSYDWLGRQFAIDLERLVDNLPTVLLFDPACNEVLEIPANFVEFHNNILVNEPEAALSISFFNEWKSTHPVEIKNNECVAIKVPLFLGGEDEVSNHEISNMELYWDVLSQLIGKLKDVPEGSNIGDFDFE